MFRHQGAILTEFNNNKGSKVQHVLWLLVALILVFKIKDIIVIKLPEDGTWFRNMQELELIMKIIL
jgi:hypothetical protein